MRLMIVCMGSAFLPPLASCVLFAIMVFKALSEMAKLQKSTRRFDWHCHVSKDLDPWHLASCTDLGIAHHTFIFEKNSLVWPCLMNILIGVGT